MDPNTKLAATSWDEFELVEFIIPSIITFLNKEEGFVVIVVIVLLLLLLFG